jgi:hypothetical protein
MSNPEDLIRRHRRLYSNIAFAGPCFEEMALSASISRLEAILEACVDRPIAETELETALSVLAERDSRTRWHAEQFRRALALNAPAARQMAARTALQGLRRAVGR